MGKRNIKIGLSLLISRKYSVLLYRGDVMNPEKTGVSSDPGDQRSQAPGKTRDWLWKWRSAWGYFNRKCSNLKDIQIKSCPEIVYACHWRSYCHESKLNHLASTAGWTLHWQNNVITLHWFLKWCLKVRFKT